MIKINMGTEIILVTTSARRGAQPQKGHGGMVHDGSSRLGTVTLPTLPGPPQHLAMSRHTSGSYNYERGLLLAFGR